MSYQELRFTCDASRAEICSELLESLGAFNITWEDAFDSPIYEPLPNTLPVWDHVNLFVLFPANTDLTTVYTALSEQGITVIETNTIADENWVEKSLAHFKPRAITDNFWICPSWESLDVPHATKLLLNPGLAFGTGEHATTQMILRYLATHTPHNTVLDFGCGSGILAISANLLGAKNIYAVDIDEQALIATHNNAQLNHISESQLHICLPDALPNIQVDQLVANIFLVPLLTLHNTFTNLLREGGELLLSGVLSTQSAQIIIAYQEHFALEIIDEQEGWLLLRGFCKKN